MTPDQVRLRLFSIAARLDASAAPSLSAVRAELATVLAAVDDQHPRGKKPAPPKPVPVPTTNMAPKPPHERLPPNRPKMDPWADDGKSMQRLEKHTQKQMTTMPEYASLQAFVSFLEEEGRDSYTVGEQKKFCEIHQMKLDDFTGAMDAAEKWPIKQYGGRLHAPPKVVDKAAHELGLRPEEIRRFIHEQEDAEMLTDSKEIVERITEYLES